MSVNKVLGVETGDIEKIDDIESSTINGIMGVSADFSKIPIGLIIPYNDTSIPDGWERFTSADDKMIVGAGNSYSPGDSGGNTSVTINASTNTTGSHSVVAEYTGVWFNVGGPNHHTLWTANPEGNHSHTVTNGTYLPQCNDIVLIKALTETNIFPVNGILLSYGNLNTTSLSNILTDNKFLKSNSSITTSGATTCNSNLSSDGGHDHSSGYYDVYGGSGGYRGKTTLSGAHGGSVNLNTTENIKKVLLSAWTNASQQFDLRRNMIGMYESLTPPEGWVLCNGSNGTPDMRDFFINTVSDGNEAAGAGDNTITISDTFNHSSSHNHVGSYSSVLAPQSHDAHNTWAWSHSHSVSANKSYLPPYYSLSFIMKQ